MKAKLQDMATLDVANIFSDLSDEDVEYDAADDLPNGGDMQPKDDGSNVVTDDASHADKTLSEGKLLWEECSWNCANVSPVTVCSIFHCIIRSFFYFVLYTALHSVSSPDASL